MRHLLPLCAVPMFVVPSAAAAAVRSNTIDLATGSVDGHRILGRTVAGVRVGDLLGRSSASLRAAVRKEYGDTFGLVRPCACTSDRCVGEFEARDGPLHVGFGTQPSTGTWLTVFAATRTAALAAG